MKLVAIVDYGMGNLDSVARAVQDCGGRTLVTRDGKDLSGADAIILPGVGAFADGIGQLRARGLEAPLREHAVDRGVPFLGICLGMQLMAEAGVEGGSTPGLGWLEAETVRMAPGAGERIPHIGWNEVRAANPSPLFDGIPDGKDFYFVHGFHLKPRDESVVSARTPYAGGFVSAVRKGNLHGVQFHPEKSQKPGFALLRNFLAF